MINDYKQNFNPILVLFRCVPSLVPLLNDATFQSYISLIQIFTCTVGFDWICLFQSYISLIQIIKMLPM